MKKKGTLIITIIIVVIGVSGFFLIPQFLDYSPWADDFFDPGDRYKWNRLNYMDVIFENESDIYTVNGAWSSTKSCPFVMAHLGFDFALNNDSKVLAAAPGQVSDIRLMDWGNETDNRYMVGVSIRFNHTVYVNYGFEPWTTDINDHEHQQRLINISIGDWVEIGQEIARFLQRGPGAHIHFDVIENNIRTRLDRYYSPVASDRMMGLIHIWHPEWPYLCYDENTPLDYVNTTFSSKLDINDVQKAYSNTTNCPWGSVHLGFDLYFKNNKRIYSATPGLIKSITIVDRGIGPNQYAINITLKFNEKIQCEYIFELWSSDFNDVNIQISKILISEGEWIMLGWNLADFHYVNTNSHVHFAIRENGDYPLLTNYFSAMASNIMLDLVQIHNSSWNYWCYYGQPWP
ncbi:MAG: M23 family metallopeptidase [Promethearchaeota archaeon]